MGLGYIGGSTKCEIRLFPSETSASGNSRTVKLAFDAKVRGGSGSWFGYPVDYKVWINNSSTGWNTLKGGEKWTGGDSRRQFSQTLTVDVGTSRSVPIRVGVELRCNGASWNGSYMEDFWVSQTNVAPGQPGWISIRTGAGATPLSGIISESITQFYIDWGAVTDPDGNTVTYTLQEERNQNGSWSTIDEGTDTAHAFWTTGGEGTSYKYSVVAGDGRLQGDWRTSNLVTKNVFTMATLSSTSSVHADASPLTFTYSGEHNTQSGVSVKYKLDCNEVTLYNGNNFRSGGQVQIVKGGSASGPYIKWSDIVNRFSNSGGIGTLTFVLTGTNSNGTQKSSETTIDVNVQSRPSGVGGATIVRNSSESPGYRKIKSSNNYYFLPDGTSGRSIRVRWNPVSGNYGDEITYTLFVSYNNGGWEEIASGLRTTVYDHIIPAQSGERTFKYLIRAISSANGNLYSDAQTGVETLHYYKDPTLIVNEVVRTANRATINLRVYTMTSIPNIYTVGRWSATGGQGKPLSRAQAPENITVTGLTEDDTYSLTVTYDDDSGFSSGQKTTYVPISANKPVFYVNKSGVGIGGVKADSSYALKVAGGTLVEEGAQINGGLVVGDIEESNLVAGTNLTGTSNGGGDANLIWRSGFYSAVNGKNYPTTKGTYYLLNLANIDNMSSKRHNVQLASEMGSGDLYFRNTEPNGSGEWKLLGGGGGDITAESIGLGKVNNWGASSSISANSTTEYATTNMVYKVRKEKLDEYLPTAEGTLTVNNPSYGRVILGVGYSDVFLQNVSSSKFLQFRDDGKLSIDGSVIGDPAYPVGKGEQYSWFNRTPVVISDGVLEIGKYIDFHANNNQDKDFNIRLESETSRLVCHGGSIHQSSDSRAKENIQYLNENKTFALEEDKTAFKNFIKDFKFATFNYKGADSDVTNFGFIAQDIAETKVGKLFVSETEQEIINKETRTVDGTQKRYIFGLADYTTVVAKALQETIQEKDAEIAGLKNELKLIKEHLGI